MSDTNTQPQAASPATSRSTDWLGFALLWLFWLCTLTAIPIGWMLFKDYGETGWTRMVVGMINAANGIACVLMIQSCRRRRKPNAKLTQDARP